MVICIPIDVTKKKFTVYEIDSYDFEMTVTVVVVVFLLFISVSRFLNTAFFTKKIQPFLFLCYFGGE